MQKINFGAYIDKIKKINFKELISKANSLDFNKTMNNGFDKIKKLTWKDIVQAMKEFKDLGYIKYVFYFVMFLVFIEIVFLIYVTMSLKNNRENLNNKSKKLNELTLYGAIDTKKLLLSGNSIGELVSIFTEEKNKKDIYDAEFKKFQAPFIYYLKYKYLPPLNIWKDVYTQDINTNLIGQLFLANNKYLDTNLLKYRGEFFKIVGKGFSQNEISNMKISDIKENTDGFYSINIDVAFAAQRHSFLMLMNKLAMTSNKKNITIINEFMYYIWNNIKEKKSEQLQEQINLKIKKIKANEIFKSYNKEQLQQKIDEIAKIDDKINEYNDTDQKNIIIQDIIDNNLKDLTADDIKKKVEEIEAKDNISFVDLVLGEIFNNWVEKNEKNDIISNEIIEEAIFNLVKCEKTDICNENDKSNDKDKYSRCEKCYFDFREKYRNIPAIAYTLGRIETNKESALKEFLASMPPLLNLTNFVFKKMDPTLTNPLAGSYNSSYNGNITLEVYGLGISDADINEIATTLGDKCFKVNNKGSVILSNEVGISKITDLLENLTDEKNMESTRIINLLELKNILTETQTKNTSLSNYNKVIKLFELYRMLDINNICDKN